MDLSSFEKEILKTGFPLENEVSSSLRNKGWNVISNKYYVDDNETTVREIDLIAYKATQVQQFSVYTALIISCKKNESNVWALLSRPLQKNDPNRNWHPVHAWTNDKSLNFQISKPEFGTDYHARMGKKALSALEDPSVDIFSFQEMNRQSGSPKNDKAIFDSITSLMKAQAYEVRALPTRKTAPSVYHFSLISVVDTEVINLLFSEGKIEASEIESEQYLANYIINKKQDISRIRFIRASAFNKIISDYDKLHRFNCRVFSEYCDEFYDGALEDRNRTKVFIEEFRKIVWWKLHWTLHKNLGRDLKREDIDLSWNSINKYVEVNVPFGGDDLEFLNKDEESNKAIKKALSEVYRYHGPFHFSEDIPF